MQKITIERSETEFYTPHSGLSLAGLLVNQHTELCRKVDLAVPGMPSVSHSDVLKSYLGHLCIGKSDFEAVAGMRHNDWFKAALHIRKGAVQRDIAAAL